MTNASQYVAFLRGINVGGHALVKMADLKKAFEKMGFTNVRTVLASGNVVFASEQAETKALAGKIESGVKKAFGKDISVLLRRLDDLKKIKSSEPFKGIKVTPSIRLYATFLPERTPPRSLKVPYVSPGREFGILRAGPMEVFCFVDLSKGKGTPEAMAVLEKEYGPNVTTRNWNTVLKILQ